MFSVQARITDIQEASNYFSMFTIQNYSLKMFYIELLWCRIPITSYFSYFIKKDATNVVQKKR